MFYVAVCAFHLTSGGTYNLLWASIDSASLSYTDEKHNMLQVLILVFNRTFDDLNVLLIRPPKLHTMGMPAKYEMPG
jgi:hypothetical protein